MILKLRLMSAAINLIYLPLQWIMLLLYKKPPPGSVPITKSLFTLSATAIAKKIRQREITSYEVVNEYIERIKKVNLYLNAIVDNRFENAILEAKRCDERLQAGALDLETLEREKPLFGVPCTIKESIAVKGCSNTGCVLLREGVKATGDAVVVELLQNAGAIVLCVTNTPEMCASFDTTNLLYGHTNNPYDSRYSAGGSSGGEGAILGAGASLIGIGSDLGGSIRIPALYNGVFGHKPTSGIVSNAKHYPLSDDKTFQKLLCIGPLTRYAEDLTLVMRIITSQCDRNLRLDVPVDIRQVKVYYRQSDERTFGILPVTAEIKNCVLQAANYFTKYDVSVEELPIEWPVTINEIALMGLMSVEEFPVLLIDVNDKQFSALRNVLQDYFLSAQWYDEYTVVGELQHEKSSELYWKEFFSAFATQKYAVYELGKSLLGLSQHLTETCMMNLLLKTNLFHLKSEILKYKKQGESIRQKLIDLLGENGIFIFPTFHRPATIPKFSLFELLNHSYTLIFNTFGFPAVHVPMGLNQDGLPIGVQVIAAPYQDRLCLAVAKELETAFGGWVPPPLAIDN